MTRKGLRARQEAKDRVWHLRGKCRNVKSAVLALQPLCAKTCAMAMCDGDVGESRGGAGGDFLEWHPWHRQRPLQVTLQILCFKLHFYKNYSEKPCHSSHKKQKVDTTHSPALYSQSSVAGRSKTRCHFKATRATWHCASSFPPLTLCDRRPSRFCVAGAQFQCPQPAGSPRSWPSSASSHVAKRANRPQNAPVGTCTAFRSWNREPRSV